MRGCLFTVYVFMYMYVSCALSSRAKCRKCTGQQGEGTASQHNRQQPAAAYVQLKMFLKTSTV